MNNCDTWIALLIMGLLGAVSVTFIDWFEARMNRMAEAGRMSRSVAVGIVVLVSSMAIFSWLCCNAVLMFILEGKK